MSDCFSELSQNIANVFIQSVLFVDDQAYKNEGGDNSFDVKQMSQESASRGLLSTAYAPDQLQDLDKIVVVGKNADILVLDWRMDCNDESDAEKSDDSEEDIADVRGDLAVNVIKRIVLDSDSDAVMDQLKLIFVYTGETGLKDISDRLNTEFSKFDKLDDFTFSFGGIRISIWAKESLAKTFKHLPENKARLRSYNQLLDEIPVEYAAVSSGVLSNTCLNALSSLRNNTYQLLAKFSPHLDHAFVAHRAMLPCPSDAGELLKETICGEFNAILTDVDISQQVSNDVINKWILDQDLTDIEITVKKATKDVPAKKITINNEKRKLWQDSGYSAFISQEVDGASSLVLNKSGIKKCERDLLKDHACLVFAPESIAKKGCNEEFAILTHQKRNYLSSIKCPFLTLGVVVKYAGRYLVCIQQNCDSMRIYEGGKRNFLFLPLKENTHSFDVLFKNEDNEYVYLLTCCKNCQDLESIEFASTCNTGVVQAQKEDKCYYFMGAGDADVKFQWILNLKEAHAQKIVNKFAANLSRVGLDESEWLRRS